MSNTSPDLPQLHYKMQSNLMCKAHCDTFKKSNQMSLNVALYQIWITFVEHHMEKAYEQKSKKSLWANDM